MALGPLGNKVSVFIYVLYLFIVGFFEFNEKNDILCQGLFGGVGNCYFKISFNG